MSQPVMCTRPRPRPGRSRQALAAGTVLAALLLSSPGRAMDDAPPPIAPAGAPDAPPAVAAAPAAPAPERPAPKPERDVRIEQKHVGRRLSEVVVTPAGFTYQYTMINLEGQESGSVLQPHPGLSIPRFFRFDF
jgi:hypothetical protein